MTPTTQVINSLRAEPELWEQTGYTLKHKNGTEVWIANGFWFLQIYIPRRNISFIEKLRLNSAIKRWNRRPLEWLREQKTPATKVKLRLL